MTVPAEVFRTQKIKMLEKIMKTEKKLQEQREKLHRIEVQELQWKGRISK